MPKRNRREATQRVPTPKRERRSKKIIAHVRKCDLLPIAYTLSTFHSNLGHNGWAWCQCDFANALRQLEELMIRKHKARQPAPKTSVEKEK
jgi:hypothetical protein